MTAFDSAWNILKGLGSERGVKGTACPQCGAQYDPDENQWTSSVGYSTDFKKPYMCHECDINFDGPAGTGEWKEHNPNNWTVGTTEGKDMVVSPAMKGGDWMEQLGAFMQDRMNPGCDEAKRIFIDQIPESPMKQGIINTTMETDCDTFIQQLEEIEAEPYGPPALIEAAKLALTAHRSKAGMDEGMA
jgi:hypothetical protein